MPDTTKSVAEHDGDESRVAAVVAAQAPRLFAAVVTKHDDATELEIAGWGMGFDDSAYMISADGRNQFFLADAENALSYVRSEPGTSPNIVWVAPAAPVSQTDG